MTRRRLPLLGALLLFGGVCCRGRESAKPVPLPAPGDTRVFTGMCDASAAIPGAGDTVVVADDENNLLRVYDAKRGGAPLSTIDLSRLLGLPVRQRKDGTTVSRELDIEAAAQLGTEAYFITSHGRDSGGRLKAERLKFFALSVGAGEPWRLYGAVYERLLDDLVGEPRLAPFRLAEASELPAKAAGGINIEGLTARSEGGLWIGFRNPVPQGRALVIPLLNPRDVALGKKAEFGEPLLLDLGGRGVRALASWRGSYLIAAGAFDAAQRAALFRWDGASAVEELSSPELGRYNPEALLATEEHERVLLLSDDGSQAIDGKECKKLRDEARQQFRGLWLTPGGRATGATR